VELSSADAEVPLFESQAGVTNIIFEHVAFGVGRMERWVRSNAGTLNTVVTLLLIGGLHTFVLQISVKAYWCHMVTLRTPPIQTEMQTR
jgi:hypothetical protein